MRIPTMRGIIDRRILANFKIDPDVLADYLPSPFRPKIFKGRGIAGICLIRLKQIRPRFLPASFGISSENAAHRIAVEWNHNGKTIEGVYIPRRDTSSRLNTLVGGRLFPGIHHYARYQVQENGERYSVVLNSEDGDTHVKVVGHVTSELPDDSIFDSLDEASNFFERGSLGYSVTGKAGQYDGLELRTFDWNVQPLSVDQLESSFFENHDRFPVGAAEFDCALLMRNINHQWHGQPLLCDQSQ